MLNTFVKAIQSGWKPDLDVTIRDEATITWLAKKNVCIVPSDKGAVQLDEEDLKLAKEYLRRNNGK